MSNKSPMISLYSSLNSRQTRSQCIRKLSQDSTSSQQRLSTQLPQLMIFSPSLLLMPSMQLLQWMLSMQLLPWMVSMQRPQWMLSMQHHLRTVNILRLQDSQLNIISTTVMNRMQEFRIRLKPRSLRMTLASTSVRVRIIKMLNSLSSMVKIRETMG